jgi:predicted lipoprotein with Yx(FWY)xxD motif
LTLFSAATAALALLAGCGSGGGKSTTTSASSAASAPATTGAAGTGASHYGAGYGAGGTSSASGGGAGVMVAIKHDGKLGSVLAAGPRKLTVYLFEADKGPHSACSGPCAVAWPPVTTSGAPQPGAGAKGSALGTITRSDGSKQVTYNGHPLYYFIKDKDSGDAYGEGVNAFGASWYALAPDGRKIDNS